MLRADGAPPLPQVRPESDGGAGPGRPRQEPPRQDEDREDVGAGGGDLHGVLGPLPHLLHTLLPLPQYNAQGVDLQCLSSGEDI